MTSKELVKTVVAALEDKKAFDIEIIDISNISVLADYFIIANGSNRTQVQAMVDNVQEMVEKTGDLSPARLEGYQAANWILMDYRDVVIHIFDQESRDFYDLARIWRDGKHITTEEQNDKSIIN